MRRCSPTCTAGFIGGYCQYCVDENGDLQTFEDRFDRMTQWMQRREGIASREEAERKVLAHMATMPAWRDHPSVRAARQ